MASQKQYFTDLLENNQKDASAVNEFINDNVPLVNQPDCYEHLIYCFMYSGLTSSTDLIIKAKDYK